MRIIFTMFFIAFISANVLAESTIKEKDVNKITNLLEKQEKAWSRGNLEKFMETYKNSGDLVMVGSGGVTYGWQSVFENYKRSYPDKKAMGDLRLEIVGIRSIDKNNAYVVGRFFLTRKAGNIDGIFTLVLEKSWGRWLIISDHSSASN